MIRKTEKEGKQLRVRVNAAVWQNTEEHLENMERNGHAALSSEYQIVTSCRFERWCSLLQQL